MFLFLFVCLRYNSSAPILTSSPFPLRSPTVIDRRRSESAWQQQRFKLLLSPTYRHFAHHHGNRIPFPLPSTRHAAGWEDSGPRLTHKQTHIPKAADQTLVWAMGRGLRLPALAIGPLRWANKVHLFPTEMRSRREDRSPDDPQDKRICPVFARGPLILLPICPKLNNRK